MGTPHTKQAMKRQADMDQQEKRDATRLCGAARHDGRSCTKRAGWGTDHPGWGRCRHHGGQLRSGLAAAANEEMRTMATPSSVSPGQALGGVLRLAAGQLVYASGQVAVLQDDDLFEDAYSPSKASSRRSPTIGSSCNGMS